jgi:hypothetical protein
MGRLSRMCIRSFGLWLLLSGLLAGAPGADPTTPRKIPRWESNLSIGGTSNGRLGVIKSFWWFGLPKVLAVGLSFDCVFRQAIPLSIDIALNAPITIVKPFICAGAGATLTGGGITHYGGGLKIRLARKFGIIAEYRRFRYSSRVSYSPPVFEKVTTDYIGAGISWAY